MSSHHIQIGDISPRIQYTGDGAQVAFTYPFPIFKDADIEVFEDTTQQTLTTDYTVSGAGNDSGGTVTFVTAPSNAVVVTLKRNITIARTSDFDESGAFRSKVINDELDTITAVQQQIQDSIDRSLRLTDTDTAGTLTLPDAETRKGNFLFFNATTGDPEAATALADPVVSVFMQTLLDDADAPAGRTTLGLGDAAVEDVAAGGSADLLRADGDGSGLTGIRDDTAHANIILNAFRIAVNGGISVQNMVDGVVDEFEDETGVDTGTSTNETYDAADDLYTNRSGVIDGTFEISNTTAASFGLGVGGSYDFMGLRFPANATDTVSSVTIDLSAVATSFNCQVSVWTDSAGSPGTKVGSNSDSTNLNSTGEKTFTWTSGAPSLTDSTTYWLVLEDVDAGSGDVTLRFGNDQGANYGTGRATTATGLSDGSGGIGGELRAEIVLGTSIISDMTLVSNATTALATPADAFIVLWQEDVDTITLNTDLKAYASRDGGATWDQITLTDEATLTTGRVLTGSDTLTSSGTSMKWKIETLNTKDQRIHGVGLEWS